MIAGLETATSGEVLIAGRRVNDLRPAQRDIAMVFQFYALYPSLTVRENLAFPLAAERIGQSEVERRVAEVARILELGHVLDRIPGRLSEGEKQRVAVGARHRPRSQLLSLRRAAVPPRRRAAPDHAGQDQGGADRPLQGDRDRHPRPARGADHGRPHRRHARRPDRAGGEPARHLRPARQPVRRELHRHAADEPGRGPAHRHAGYGAPASRWRAGDRRAVRGPRRPPRRRAKATLGIRPRAFDLVAEGDAGTLARRPTSSSPWVPKP